MEGTSSIITQITPLIDGFKTDILAVMFYAIPIGFTIYGITWGIKFAKKQITKNSKSA